MGIYALKSSTNQCGNWIWATLSLDIGRTCCTIMTLHEKKTCSLVFKCGRMHRCNDNVCIIAIVSIEHNINSFILLEPQTWFAINRHICLENYPQTIVEVEFEQNCVLLLAEVVAPSWSYMRKPAHIIYSLYMQQFTSVMSMFGL